MSEEYYDVLEHNIYKLYSDDILKHKQIKVYFVIFNLLLLLLTEPCRIIHWNKVPIILSFISVNLQTYLNSTHIEYNKII